MSRLHCPVCRADGRDVVLGTRTRTRVQLEYKFEVLVLVPRVLVLVASVLVLVVKVLVNYAISEQDTLSLRQIVAGTYSRRN